MAHKPSIRLEDHLGLCRIQAHKWIRGRGERLSCPIEDTEEYGDALEGLCRAAKTFDPSKGCAFSTWASIWIIQKIRRKFQQRKKMKMMLLSELQTRCDGALAGQFSGSRRDPIVENLCKDLRQDEPELLTPFERIWQTLVPLNRRQRRLVFLHYVMGLTFREIGRTEKVVFQRVQQITRGALEFLKLRYQQTPLRFTDPKPSREKAALYKMFMSSRERLD